MSQMQAAVTIRGAWKRYGSRATVKDLTLTVPSGVIFGLLGPNGAGKTTTIEMIAGLRSLTQGAIQVLGLDPVIDHGLLAAKVAIQPQEASLFSTLTVAETLRLWATFYARSANPDRVLGDLGLQGMERTRFSRLSGGQKRRVLVATALVAGTELIILDEPTSGLDPWARDRLWEVLRARRLAGGTIIISTHSMQEAQSLCDLVAIIDAGQLQAAGSPQELIHQHAGTQVLLYADQAGVRHEEQTPDPAEALAALSAAGVVLRDIEIRTGDLDDVFRRLTGRTFERQPVQ